MVVAGHTDTLRFYRQCVFLLHRSFGIEHPVDILSELPLPFDDELRKGQMEEKQNAMSHIEMIYRNAQRNNNAIKKKIAEKKKLKIA